MSPKTLSQVSNEDFSYKARYQLLNVIFNTVQINKKNPTNKISIVTYKLPIITYKLYQRLEQLPIHKLKNNFTEKGPLSHIYNNRQINM